MALETARDEKPVFMLGDIVHNENVVARIQEAGIKKIRRLSGGKGKILLIRAHGCSRGTLLKAERSGYSIIDATCPMVKEIHSIARKLERDGYGVIVIGDKMHDEVKGISGQLKKKALIIDKPEGIPLKKVRTMRRAGIVVQSTQNLDNALKIVDILRVNIPEIKFHNTICKPTRTKQDEIKTMPLKNDVIIVIGSRTSANTKRIYEISKSLNDKTYWVNSGGEIRKAWLSGAANVGITAGASTPESTIRQVICKIESISRA